MFKCRLLYGDIVRGYCPDIMLMKILSLFMCMYQHASIHMWIYMYIHASFGICIHICIYWSSHITISETKQKDAQVLTQSLHKNWPSH